ncbi:hypothetical protein PO124_07665 [Bacillus licheniformis]|nr:hypothetical protein [Bacillus licheniformis]
MLHHSFDLQSLADHMLNRLDDLAKGMIKRNDQPLIPFEKQTSGSAHLHI